MKIYCVLIVVLAMLSFNSIAGSQNEPSKVVASFLSHMKVKEYAEASAFVANDELKWLHESSISLMLNDELVESIGIKPMSDVEVKKLSLSDVFAIMSIGTWEKRDKSFGEYSPDSVLGSVLEGDAMAHVVVRDLTNSDHDAVVYTLVREGKQWRLKLPRIMKGTVALFIRIYG